MEVHVDLFDAIADETRRRILGLLHRRSLRAGEIARRFPEISRPAVTKHLSILRRAGLVRARRIGREVRYSLNTTPLAEVARWLRQFQAY